MRVRIIALLVILFGLTAGADADQVVDGRIGPGALYRIVVPTDDPTDPADAPWNGSLLLYAHGFVSAPGPKSPCRPTATCWSACSRRNQFAVAVSSFSENGWAVKDGAQRTQQLLGIFMLKFGAPSRIYTEAG